MKEERIQYLLEQYVNKASSREELNELMELAKDPTYKELIEQYMDERYDSMLLMEGDTGVDWESMYRKVIGSEPAKVYKINEGPKRRMWMRWVAAAVILLVVGGLWFVVSRKSQVTGDKVQVAKTNDVEAPKETRAVIVLADGRKVYLDSVGNGMLAQEGNVKVVKLDNGQIAYQTESGDPSTPLSMTYNTLNNPRGSKVATMTLNDGTKVWLNAGSSVTYPVAFVGNERKVEITGEAYFEVTHDAKKPFVVGKGETSVTVLGTHFNVNAYDDEDALRVTLLEGSIAVKNENSNVKIVPGEQAVIVNDIRIKKDVDVDEVMAWKNGVFKFKDATIEMLMRQIARWYDVEVSYEGKVTNHFIATIPRTVSAANAFKILEQTGGVNFIIEGNKVIVKR